MSSAAGESAAPCGSRTSSLSSPRTRWARAAQVASAKSARIEKHRHFVIARENIFSFVDKTIVFNSCRSNERRRAKLTCRFIAYTEIGAIGMMKYERAYAGFWVHHEALGELHADFFRLEELPHSGLVLEIGARGITEAIALAAIPRSKALGHGHFRGIGEAPVFADTAVQPFRAGFGCFMSQRLQAMTHEII